MSRRSRQKLRDMSGSELYAYGDKWSRIAIGFLVFSGVCQLVALAMYVVALILQ